MQPKIDTRNGPRASVHCLQNAAKGLFLSPLFIICLVSVFSFLSLCLFSFFFEMKRISIPFTSLSDIMSQFAPWDKLAWINVYAGLVVTALALIGFAVVLFNMATQRFGSRCKIGFYLIKIPMFFQNILTMLSVTLITVKLVRDLVMLFDSTVQGVYIWSAVQDVFVWLDWTTLVVLTIVVVVLAAVYLLFFSFKSLMTVSVMKEAICSETPIINQYLFTAVGYFIFAAVGIALQLRFGFNLTLTFGCVSIVLFGVLVNHAPTGIPAVTCYIDTKASVLSIKMIRQHGYFSLICVVLCRIRISNMSFKTTLRDRSQRFGSDHPHQC